MSDDDKQARYKAYWRTNLRYLAILLSIWFAVSFGAGIIFVDELDQFRIAGFKLGFWFAQQGSILVFVVLIFVYVYLMNRLDKKFQVDDGDEDSSAPSTESTDKQ
jgi:putative solute:sodium symporter small subunit